LRASIDDANASATSLVTFTAQTQLLARASEVLCAGQAHAVAAEPSPVASPLALGLGKGALTMPPAPHPKTPGVTDMRWMPT